WGRARRPSARSRRHRAPVRTAGSRSRCRSTRAARAPSRSRSRWRAPSPCAWRALSSRTLSPSSLLRLGEREELEVDLHDLARIRLARRELEELAPEALDPLLDLAEALGAHAEGERADVALGRRDLVDRRRGARHHHAVIVADVVAARLGPGR